MIWEDIWLDASKKWYIEGICMEEDKWINQCSKTKTNLSLSISHVLPMKLVNMQIVRETY